MLSDVQRILGDHLATIEATQSIAPDILRAAEMVTECLRNGGKIMLCGNGGSAADAQHIAGEFVSRFFMERRALPALALHTNTTVMTAIGNDYSFDVVYARQVEAHGRPGDLLIAITTSGTSANILRAAERAREVGVRVIGIAAVNRQKRPKFISFELDDDLINGQAFAGRRRDLLDLAVLVGLEDVFHLHGLNDRQFFPGLDVLTDLDRYFTEQAGHWRKQEFGQVGSRLVRHQGKQFRGAGAHHHEIRTIAPVEKAVPGPVTFHLHGKGLAVAGTVEQ